MLSSSASPPEPSRKRQRARTACMPCRKRKRKCDGSFPCYMCATYGYSCQFPRDEGPSASFVDRSSNHVDDQQQQQHEDEEEKMATTGSMKSSVRDKSVSLGVENGVGRGILDPVKTRYMGLHSAVAFPRRLGLDLQSVNPPHLHSFAWNCGIREEEEVATRSHRTLKTLISRDDFDRYSAVYFETVQPIFGILDREQFMKSATGYWGTVEDQTTDFDAVIAAVVSLGSFFSASRGHPKEAEIVQHAKGVLENPLFSRKPTIDQVAASLLRTVYLRATTRPHTAWLSSCLTIHLAEATGLHHEMDAVVLTTDNVAKTIGRSHRGCEAVRNLFWSAWSINRMISYEYGRSSVILQGITTKPVKQVEGSYSAWHVALAQLVPQDHTDTSSHASKSELYKALLQLEQVPDTHPFVILSKADLCMCFYRRLRLLKPGLERQSVLQIISIGNAALASALQLAESHHFWWQVLCTVFQYICILLAIDSRDSLENVKEAVDTLDKIAGILNTHVASEANSTAKVLLRDAVRKKKMEVELLEKADCGTLDNGALEGIELGDIDWDALLDPSFTINFIPPTDLDGF